MSSGRLAIVVGGGPAPGINAVISSAAIEAINEGFEVFGIQDGFKWLIQEDSSKIRPAPQRLQILRARPSSLI